MKRMILMLALAVGLLAPAVAFAASPAPAYASAFNSDNATKQACSGINGSESEGGCSTPGRSLTSIVRVILYLLSAIAGVASVIMIILAGFKFITAAGDAGKVASGRSTLIYAVIGAVVVAMAQFIVQFVLKEVT
jgi:hypothetical protein